MERIDGVGAMLYYLFEEPHRRAVVAMYAFDTRSARAVPATVDELTDYVMTQIGDQPLLYRRLVPTPLNLDNPVWVADAAKPGRGRVSARTVRGAGTWDDTVATLAAIASEPDACEVPLEVILLDGVNAHPQLPEGAVVVALRTDHAAMDGTARAALERQLFTPEPARWQTQPPVAYTDETGIPSRLLIFLTALMLMLARIVAFVRLAGEARRIGKETEKAPPDTWVSSALDTGPDEPNRVNEFFTVSLTTVKKARAAVPGATVNDVVTAAVATAVRYYLEEIGELPEEPLRCFIPIAVPAASGRTEGNHITRGTVPLWTSIDDDAERLRCTHDSIAAVKARVASGPQIATERAALTLFAPLAARGHRRDTVEGRGANTVVTNVFRGPQPLYLGDARCVRTHIVSALNKGAPLSHQVTNLEGELMVSLSGGAGALRHPQRYRELLERAFSDLAGLTDLVRRPA
ncbi:wax ester/triacylglycerol synthase domain-containing protein [Hoyosella subflava]|uniref:diacylglycerol O-acyltransferase n=1 Tax=Hoyosella subflava (strain DSM 45089 / JCM 17490 / NBRC 109087 / DQS3-9A1) TaxID=443218 RepID=F6EI66_HOYSD|nr:wax ester/triacylglycerol synthase domain-containing protein [Hoyosella subflava]AEF41173.1 hypothetical protein AS9A_2726 [Hoyosella subflava DQS3-9A1]